VIADGENNPPAGSTSTRDEVISEAQAQGIPIFTVGLGDLIDRNSLVQIAEQTGGQFYNPTTPENLRTVYIQLAESLINNQYVIEYDSNLNQLDSGTLQIGVTYSGLSDEDFMDFEVCP
jgi:Ca-activated chloride channel family protein